MEDQRIFRGDSCFYATERRFRLIRHRYMKHSAISLFSVFAEERPWLITGVFFIGIFLPRFLIEYVKNVQVQSEYEMIARYGMNLGQMLSIPFILIGIILVIRALTQPRKHFTFPNRFADEKKA